MMQVQILFKFRLIKIWILLRGFGSNIWEPGLGGWKCIVRYAPQPLHTLTGTHRQWPCTQVVQADFKGPDLVRNSHCGKVTWRCQTTGNYPKSLSAQSTAIFIVLWQIYTQSGTPGLARRPALTNCQGRGAVICLRWGFLHSLLKTCGFTFPLSLQEMAGQWNAE